MSENENSSALKRENVKKFFSNNKSILVISVFILIFLLRFYFFILTKNQPIWWDESEYMAGAKAYAGLVQYELPSIRSPGLSLLVSIFFRLGLGNEVFLRFFLAFLPSVLVLALTYFCIREMYPDKKVALISIIIFSVIWEHVFYSNRFHTENLSLIFQTISIYIVFKGYLKNEPFFKINPKYWWLFVLISSAVSVFFRPGNVIFFPAIVLFVIFLNSSRFFNKKGLVILVALYLLSIGGLKFASTLPKEGFLSYLSNLDKPLAWNSLTVFKGFYPSNIQGIPSFWYYSFLIAIALFLIEVWIDRKSFREIKPNKDRLETKSNIFNIFLIISVLLFFIAVLRNPTFEYRWYFPLAIGMIALTSNGIITISQFVSSSIGKNISKYLIILVLVLGVYSQVTITDNLVKNKVKSYSEVKDSGIWIKENSNKEDIIISASLPQHAYYSERKVLSFGLNLKDPMASFNNETIFREELIRIRPKYIVLSSFEPAFTPTWAFTWPEKNQDIVSPVKIYYVDPTNTQPILIIYEFKKDSL